MTKAGLATTISREQLEGLPTIERSLSEYMRHTPQANLVQRGDGTSMVELMAWMISSVVHLDFICLGINYLPILQIRFG